MIAYRYGRYCLKQTGTAHCLFVDFNKVTKLSNVVTAGQDWLIIGYLSEDLIKELTEDAENDLLERYQQYPKQPKTREEKILFAVLDDLEERRGILSFDCDEEIQEEILESCIAKIKAITEG